MFGPESSQHQVFDNVAKNIVTTALDGVNCTIFAYGQTGSGKTYTMCGGKNNFSRDRGIIPRTLNTIFSEIDERSDGVRYTVSMSMVEIYKERGYDLLSKGIKHGSHTVFPAVTVSVQGQSSAMHGAKQVALASEDDGLNQYFIGDLNRTVAETPLNLASSRSHCVCTIFIEASDAPAQIVRKSKIQIVDLAGSERLKVKERGSEQKKHLMEEAISINKSLHCLSLVIAALNDGSSLIPYRNSYLTKLLIDALGGNAKASMVMTVDPSEVALPETLSSCRFAQRVANVKNAFKINEERDPQTLITELKRQNAELQAALNAAKSDVAAEVNPTEAEEVPEDDVMRERVRTFLEDEEQATKGGSTLRVGRFPQGAFVAFRIFRELFWEKVARRWQQPRQTFQPNTECGAVTMSSEVLVHSEHIQSRPGGGSVEAIGRSGDVNNDNVNGDSEVRTLLDEAQAECRMLRAALAAMPPARPVPKERGKPRKEVQLEAELWASKGEIRRLKAALATFAKVGKDWSLPPKAKPKVRTKRPRRPASSGPQVSGNDDSTAYFSSDASDLHRAASFCSTTTWERPALQRPLLPKENTAEPVENTTTGSNETLGRRHSNLLAARTAEPQEVGTQQSQNAASVALEPGANGSAVSSAWLGATTALTADDLRKCGNEVEAYKVFLQRDPRAGDVWQDELQRFRMERRNCKEEAKTLGDAVVQAKESMGKVQAALQTLKARLLEADNAASVDASAVPRAEVLRKLLAEEEPKLEQRLEEKKNQYNRDIARLLELRREIGHHETSESKLKATVQGEFATWYRAVEKRYPVAIAQARAADAAEDFEDKGDGDGQLIGCKLREM